MKWNIITDSSCDLLPKSLPEKELQISSVPFTISVGNRDFVDDERLDTAAMLEAMEKYPKACSTACPSPQGWIEQFEKADQSIAVTISSKLSGSFNSAMIAKKMTLEKYPDKKIAVVDSGSTGPELALGVEEIARRIENGVDFESVIAYAADFFKKTKIMFALSSFDNLIKSGRMSKLTGFIARTLGMWGIGQGSDRGTIEMKAKARGTAKAVAMLIEDMKRRGFHGGRVAISHCCNLPLAQRLEKKIQELWSNSEVSILPARGLCSYYAERGGLIVSY